MVWDVVGDPMPPSSKSGHSLVEPFSLDLNQFGYSRSLYAGSRKWVLKKVNIAYLGTQNKMRNPK